jgi:AcrR family transcriptional regulator
MTNDKRVAILNAACQVVKDDGFTSLTLEAVANKGGLLYHFPSKTELISGMVNFITSIYSKKIADCTLFSEQKPGAFLRSYISMHEIEAYEKDMRFGILAAAASDPSLLVSIREFDKQWQMNVENDGLDPVIATILKLATDALVMNELLQIGHLDEEMKKRVIERMISMTYL